MIYRYLCCGNGDVIAGGVTVVAIQDREEVVMIEDDAQIVNVTDNELIFTTLSSELIIATGDTETIVVECADGITYMAQIEIYEGDTPDPIRTKIDSVLVANTSCRKVVRPTLDDATVIDAEVTAKVTVDSVEYFHVYLEPAETDLLSPGEYVYIIELYASGQTPEIKREIHMTLLVKQQGSTL